MNEQIQQFYYDVHSKSLHNGSFLFIAGRMNQDFAQSLQTFRNLSTDRSAWSLIQDDIGTHWCPTDRSTLVTGVTVVESHKR